MRLLLDPGVYDMRNKGNVAMLQVAVQRLQQRLPGALIGVITVSPQVLKLYCPTAHPVSIDDDASWSRFGGKSGRLQRALPRRLLGAVIEAREQVWQRLPVLRTSPAAHARSSARYGAPASAGEAESAGEEVADREMARAGRVASVAGADVVIAPGAGNICDIAAPHAMPVLDRLEAAAESGKPTIMLSQQIGLIHDPDLLSRVKAVLPRVDLIATRQEYGALDLLETLGVDPGRVAVTGDDAVEMAYEARSAQKGCGIGIGIRIADYTRVGAEHIASIRRVVHMMGKDFRAPLIPLPISYDLREADAECIKEIASGYPRVASVGWRRFGDPMEIVKRTASCRVVVTGAYHTAVFALAQGIPTVCVASSEAYLYKLRGLAYLFGDGCHVVNLGSGDLEHEMATAIDLSWVSFEQIRPRLLESASRQVALARKAYERAFDLIESKIAAPTRAA